MSRSFRLKQPPAGRRPRRLVEASISANTRRTYAGALRRLDAWLDGHQLEDTSLAAYLAQLHDAGRASSSALMAVAAARFRAKLAGQRTPAGELTARIFAGYRRTAGDRGRGQARPFGAADLAAVLATCHRPRRRGRGVERRVTAHSGRVGLASELTARRRVHHRRDARRELEDLEDGGALLGRGHRRTRGCGALPVRGPETSASREASWWVLVP